MKYVYWITLILLLIGGLNWGLVGTLDKNLVTHFLGIGSIWTKIVYDLVGLSAIWIIIVKCMKIGKK